MALVLERLLLALILAFCAVAAIAPKSAPAAEVTLILDQAKLIRLPEKVATTTSFGTTGLAAEERC